MSKQCSATRRPAREAARRITPPPATNRRMCLSGCSWLSTSRVGATVSDSTRRSRSGLPCIGRSMPSMRVLPSFSECTNAILPRRSSMNSVLPVPICMIRELERANPGIAAWMACTAPR